MKKQKNKTAGLQKRQAIAGYLFISPFIVGFLVFMIKPFFQSLYMSFCDVQIGAGSFNPIWQGFTNYVKAFRVDPDFTRLLVEEIARMAVYSLAIMVFSFFVSLILNQKFKGRALVRAIFFLPVILSSGVIIGLETDNALMASLEASIEQTTSGISVTAAMENILRTAGIGTRAYEEVFELIMMLRSRPESRLLFSFPDCRQYLKVCMRQQTSKDVRNGKASGRLLFR